MQESTLAHEGNATFRCLSARNSSRAFNGMGTPPAARDRRQLRSWGSGERPWTPAPQAAHEGVRTTESLNHSGWKRPLRSSSPTVTLTPPCLLNYVPKCHIHTAVEPLQGWGLHHCPGQPGPMPDHSCSKEIFPNIQSKPSLTQLEAIASHPIAS